MAKLVSKDLQWGWRMCRRTCFINKTYRVLILLLSLGIASEVAFAQCLIKLGYRLEDKSPFMAAVADNSGLYSDIYTRAAESINCQLVIVRKPKKRILADLYAGKIDIYPAYNYTEQRANSVFFIATGLVKKNVGISRLSLTQITHLAQLQGHKVIVALGSLDRYENFPGVQVIRAPNLSIGKVIAFLYLKRADFYYANYSEYLYAIKKNPLQGGPLKVHHYCCGGEKVVYLAFSKKSVNFKEIANPDFKFSEPMSVANFPTMLDPSSVAYQFKLALQQMKKQGVTEKLFDKYFR